MGVIGLLIFGLYSYQKMSIELFPDVAFPVVTITTIYPGASPEIVESTITKPIEEVVALLSNVETIHSQSAENVSLVIIRFVMEMDPDDAFQAVQNKLTGIHTQLPKESDQPVIERIDMGSRPILNVIVSGTQHIGELTHHVEQIVKPQFQQLSGVGSVDVLGGREREIRIWLSIAQMKKYNVTVQDIAQAFQMENLEIPGGSIQRNATSYAITTKGKFQSLDQLRNMIVRFQNQHSVLLSHVAKVEDGLEKRTTVAKHNGSNALVLVIRKQSGANDVAVAKAVKATLPDLRSMLPAGMSLKVTQDSSLFVEHTVDHSLVELIIGGLMAVLITFVFLRNVRSTIIVLAVLPTTIITTFLLMVLFGFTLNFVTLVALSLSVGLLIDDAIVVIENIWRHLEMGKPPVQAAREAANQIQFAIIAISLSILAVFVSVAFAEGMIGEFLFQFGITISSAILISLIFALTLSPMMASRILKKPTTEPTKLIILLERFFIWLEQFYKRILTLALNHRRITLLIAIASLILAVGIGSQIPFELLPEQDRSQFSIAVEADPGTSLVTMEAYIDKINTFLMDQQVIETVVSTIAGDVMKRTNQASIAVTLVDKSKRDRSQKEIVQHLRITIKQLIQESKFPLKFSIIQEIMEGAGGQAQRLNANAAVQVSVRGPELETLRDIARFTVAKWKEIPGMVDVSHSFQPPKPGISIVPIRSHLAQVGVPLASVATTIQALVGGQRIGMFDDQGEEYTIRLQLVESERDDPLNMEHITVRNYQGQLVQLRTLVDLIHDDMPMQIDRFKRQRHVLISANLNNTALGDATDQAVQQLEAILSNYSDAYTMEIQGQSKMMQESMASLIVAMILAAVMIYLIMASLFNSVIQPFIIVLSIPLCFVGAFLFLFLIGANLSLMSMIALLMLMGLVVKNAILLIDFTNELRKQNKSVFQSLLEACPLRLRPILMTTFAMIFGMIPIAIGLGDGSEIRSPMALAIIGGLTSSTLLTLLVVPVLYMIADRFRSQS